MKLLVLFLGVLALAVFVLPLMVVAVVATHPWLAVGALTSAPTVVQQMPSADPTVAPVPSVSGMPFTPAELVAEAMKWVTARVPYAWGGCTTRGVDCSCFVHNVLSVFGINTPRTTTEQIRWAAPVAREQLEVGDIVFFNNTCKDCGVNPTHEGLYVGGGQMIEAGDPVQVASVFTGFYGARYAGAGRPHR